MPKVSEHGHSLAMVVVCHSWSDWDKAGDPSERQMSKAISRSPVSKAGMLTALQALEELKGKAY